MTTIDPTKYAMHAEDGLWVAELLKDRAPGDEVNKVNGLLEWMNRGPSAA